MGEGGKPGRDYLSSVGDKSLTFSFYPHPLALTLRTQMCLERFPSLYPHSCSDAQKISWTPPGTAVQFYSNLQNAEVRQRDILRLNTCSSSMGCSPCNMCLAVIQSKAPSIRGHVT